MKQYRVMSCFEQVALQQQNAALQAQVDSLLLLVETNNHAIGDNVHDQISDYWKKEEEKREQIEGDYLSWFIVVFFTSFILGYVASYYHYV